MQQHLKYDIIIKNNCFILSYDNFYLQKAILVLIKTDKVEKYYIIALKSSSNFLVVKKKVVQETSLKKIQHKFCSKKS